MKIAPRGRPSSDLDRALLAFRTHLIGRRLTDGYVDHMVAAVRKGFGDPIAYLNGESSASQWRLGRRAWMHWCDWTENEDLQRILARLQGPRALPPKVRVLPTEHQLRLAAEAAVGTAAPLGALLWMTQLSGLRIGEVVRISSLEAQQALRDPEVVIRQKGPAGKARRRWVPGCLIRPALAVLLRLPPWLETYVLLGTTPSNAAEAIRRGLGAFHPHDYRHAVARLLRRLGISMDVVSAVLGHDLRNVLGTTAIYAPPAPEEIEEAHGRLAAYLWPAGLLPPEGSWLGAEGLPGIAPPGWHGYPTAAQGRPRQRR